ncbi:MAG: hypothetical protein LBJ44_09145 [Propionibacteriaceae bacterium]|nr:hypothetical protein [Propionibacteriaceae bacterium]
MSRYRWQAEPAPRQAALTDDLDLGFDQLAEAEEWLGAFHADLAQAGVERVTLWQDGAVLLGPMELDPATSQAGGPASDEKG